MHQCKYTMYVRLYFSRTDKFNKSCTYIYIYLTRNRGQTGRTKIYKTIFSCYFRGKSTSLHNTFVLIALYVIYYSGKHLQQGNQRWQTSPAAPPGGLGHCQTGMCMSNFMMIG